jgi:hypothetical protein
MKGWQMEAKKLDEVIRVYRLFQIAIDTQAEILTLAESLMADTELQAEYADVISNFTKLLAEYGKVLETSHRVHRAFSTENITY